MATPFMIRKCLAEPTEWPLLLVTSFVVLTIPLQPLNRIFEVTEGSINVTLNYMGYPVKQKIYPYHMFNGLCIKKVKGSKFIEFVHPKGMWHSVSFTPWGKRAETYIKQVSKVSGLPLYK